VFSAIDGLIFYWSSWMGFGVPRPEGANLLHWKVQQKLKKMIDERPAASGLFVAASFGDLL